MLAQLQPNVYPRVRPLFDALAFNIEIPSILHGNTRGQVFADIPDQPRHALIWDELGTLFVAGPAAPDPTTGDFLADVHAWAEETAIARAREWGIPDLTLFYDPPAWQPHLAALFDGYDPTPSRRYAFTHTGTPQPLVALPDRVTLHRVDADVLGDGDRVGVDWLRGWILSFWPSPDEFLDRGVGYVVLAPDPDGGAGDAVVSLCVSVFVSGAAYELGTATHDAYRNQGLSTAVTQACVNDCLARGLRPIWHCWTSNAPSVAVARKAGFELQGEHEVLRLWMPKAGAAHA